MTGLVELLLLAGIVATFLVSRMVMELVTSVHLSNSQDRILHSSTKPSLSWFVNLGEPLPTLDEIQDSCVYIAREAQYGNWYLCTDPTTGSLQSTCEPDEGFSSYYGQPVFVCQL